MALYAFDGTGDNWQEGTPITPTQQTGNGRFITNVVMFLGYYQLATDKQAYYFPGVGISGGWLGRCLGRNFGIGASRRVKAAFAALQKTFSAGDEEIVIIGYSRGAATARLFAEKIHHDYKKLNDQYGKPLKKRPPIHFLGLFDTVASFGIPTNNFEWGFKAHILLTVQNTVHAMALCERTKGFGLDRAYGRNVSETWFLGGHGDIGGNAEIIDPASGARKRNNGRTNITLLYMLKKAKSCGVEVKIPDDLPIDYDAPLSITDDEHEIIRQQASALHDNTVSLSHKVAESREVFNNDVMHFSVYESTFVKAKTHDIARLILDKDSATIE